MLKNLSLKAIIESVTKKEVKVSEDVKMPDKQVVTTQISGVDIMDLEDAVKELWKNGVYAESGMGCTGPIVLVNDAKGEVAVEMLLKAGYTAK